MIENLNRIENCYYVIRTKAGNGGIKEITELPDRECDIEMNFEVVTSNKYYVDNHKDNPYLHICNIKADRVWLAKALCLFLNKRKCLPQIISL